MNLTLHDPFVIETDVKVDIEFFRQYMDQMDWVDTNVLYDEHNEYQETMYGRKMVKHYIKHVSEFDIKLKKFVIKTFKDFGISTRNWRADFFLTEAGGSMPMHVDGMSKIALLLPLSENTGPLVCENNGKRFEITYQNLTILNTQVSHGVEAPTKDRLLFRIAVHDVLFDEIGVYKKLTG